MRFLVTTSRMPFALDEIRKLGKTGHEVIASDTFRTAPGSHSRYVEESFLTPSPRFETEAFVDAVREIVDTCGVDCILPAFEEALFLARDRDELGAPLFAPSFETLLTLHNKVTFLRLANDLGLRTPRTTVVTSGDDLRAAIADEKQYFARPAFSRGGVQLLTNTGPLAGAIAIDDCHPSAASPWIVQEFVWGEDVCTFSVVQHGRIAAHSAYVHPREIEHTGGIVFRSVDEPQSLAIARRVAEAVDYHGQLSFDFRRTESGLTLIECNPRPTAGVFLMPPETFVDALLDETPGEPRVVAPGVTRRMIAALLRDVVLHWREAADDLPYIFSRVRDVYAEPGDLAPALYQVLSYSHVVTYRRQRPYEPRQRSDLVAAYFFDVSFDGAAS